MKISKSTNDQLMVMAAHRYCLGRSSYIVGSCIEWIDEHWEQISNNTQSVIVRDTIEAIHDGLAGEDMDKADWQKLAFSLWGNLDTEQQVYIKSALAHKCDARAVVYKGYKDNLQ